MNELIRKEMRELLCKNRLAYNLMSLAMMLFVLWNFTNNLPQFAQLFGREMRLILLLLPAYLITFLAILLIKNFALEKRMGILEAVLATGISKLQISMARSIQVTVVAGLQSLLLLAFVDVMLRLKLRTSLLAYWTNMSDYFILIMLSLFALASIWLLVSLVLCYSYLADFMVLLAFALLFLYAGFYYQMRYLPTLINMAILLIGSGFLVYKTLILLRLVPNDKIIMD